MGLFITFEGGEGCGKSTQAKRLASAVERNGSSVSLFYEPGVTPLGLSLRRYLKRIGRGGITPEAELLLFAAARSELTTTRLLPALRGKNAVICDRYADSTTAYQGYGRGLPLETVGIVNQLVTGGLLPHLTVLLDMDPALALQRKGSSRDRFEHEAVEFHYRVRRGYLEMSRLEPARWLVLDASRPRDIIAREIWSRVSVMLGANRAVTRHSL